MSEALKYKLHNHEVPPPERVWQKISLTLDEELISRNFPSNIYEFEVTPAPSVWENISVLLDDQDLPASLPKKLQSYAAAPPARVWEKIAATLEETREPGDPVPIHRRRYPIFRYAAAAAIVGALAFGASRFFSYNNQQTGVAIEPVEKNAAGQNDSVVVPANHPQNDLPKPEQAVARQPSTRSNPLAGRQMAWMDWTVDERNLPEYDIAKDPAILSETFSTEDFLDRDHVINYQAAPIDFDPSKIGEGNRYMLFMTPDGYLVRISKTLANMVGCLYDAATTDPECRDKVRQLREKMARSSLSPTPGNFMDILDLMKTLEENRP